MKIKSRPDAIAKLMTDLVAGLPECAEIYVEALESPQDKRPLVLQKMNKAEARADKRQDEFLERVAETFITPFDREDLLSMAEVLDDTIDLLDHCVDLLVRLEIDELPKSFITCARDLHEMCVLAAGAVEVIKKPKKFRTQWHEASAVENRMDTRHNEITADLLNGKYEIFKALKLKEIADTTENAANMLDEFLRSLARAAIKET